MKLTQVYSDEPNLYEIADISTTTLEEITDLLSSHTLYFEVTQKDINLTLQGSIGRGRVYWPIGSQGLQFESFIELHDELVRRIKELDNRQADQLYTKTVSTLGGLQSCIFQPTYILTCYCVPIAYVEALQDELQWCIPVKVIEGERFSPGQIIDLCPDSTL